MSYAIIETLNGNYILKELSKVKETDNVETELYGDDLADIKKQFKAYVKRRDRAIRR